MFRFERNKPFRMFDDVQIEPLSLKVEEGAAKILGSCRFQWDGVIVNHSRSFECRNGGVIITDKVICPGHHQLALYFHLAPGIECKQEYEKYILAANDQRVMVDFDSTLNGQFLEDTISEHYGTEKTHKHFLFTECLIMKYLL